MTNETKTNTEFDAEIEAALNGHPTPPKPRATRRCAPRPKQEAIAAAQLQATIDAVKARENRARLPAKYTAEIIITHFAALRKTRPLTKRELRAESKAKQASGLYK